MEAIENENYFKVRYGRVGAAGQEAQYPISKWEQKYSEKIRKGYEDQTALHQIRPVRTNVFSDVTDTSIQNLIMKLQSYARDVIRSNYTVASENVTEVMIKEAQELIDQLMNVTALKDFNSILVQLFHVIPRVMSSVAEYTATTTNDYPKIIKREQELLDIMNGQVVTYTQSDDEKTQSLFDAYGLKFDIVTDDDMKIIKNKMGRNFKGRLKAAWKVTNLKTQKAFDKYQENHDNPKTEFFWHGSRNENWWSILRSGLVLRPTNAIINGKMFGQGIYFAPNPNKSLNYTSLHGARYTYGSSNSAYMALYETSYGDIHYDVYQHKTNFYQYDYKALQKQCPGASCLHAHAGSMLVNDEIIFYREDQITVKYIVEIAS